MERMGSSIKADSGADPQLVEDDIFRIIIPPDRARDRASKKTPQDNRVL